MCGIIFGGSPRDVDVTQNCIALPQIALRCGATFLQRIPLTASVSTNYHLFPKCISHRGPRRDGLRNAACAVKYRSAKLQLCFLPALSPAFATDRFKVSGARRRYNYNIPADTCARLTAQLPASECFSDGRRGGARRRGVPIPIDLSLRRDGGDG